LCRHFFPAGRRVGNEWWIGNLRGEPGDSLKFELAEVGKEGVYCDFATQQSGNMLSAIMAARGCTIAQAAELIGQATGRPIDNGSGPPPGPSAQYHKSTGSTQQTAIDWDRDYRPGAKQLEELAAWRGLSIEFCQWLARERLIGRQGPHWVFPVLDGAGVIVSVHKRLDKNKWTFQPNLKSLGLNLTPSVIGDLAPATRVISSESQWDLFNALDKLGAHNGEPIAGIATRGAGNARLVGQVQFSSELYAIGQNDAAGVEWLETLKTIRPFKWIPVPAAYHDAGDWLVTPTGGLEFIDAFKRARDYRYQIPVWLESCHIDQFETKLPAEILEGVFCDGQVIAIQGGSKGRKTWFVMQLLWCIANGLPFLRIPAFKRRVLDIDLELQRPFIRKRFEQIQAALGGRIDNLEVSALRGHVHELEAKHLEMLAQMIEDKAVGLFNIDPIYRLLGTKQENLTSDVSRLLEPFLAITQKLIIAFLYAHHFAKGDPAMREAIDRGSGSGVFGRLPDVIIDLAPHKERDCLIVSVIQRNYPEITPFVIRWENFLFHRDDKLNPGDLRKRSGTKPGGGQPTYIPPESALKFITVLEEIPRSEFIDRMMRPNPVTGKAFCARRTAFDIIKFLIETERLIETAQGRKKYVRKA
jgi:hypothetical protein